MTTYTIAYLPDVLLALLPDGQDIHAEVAREATEAGINVEGYETESGLTLTDDCPEDLDRVVWSHRTLLTAEGRLFHYAVRP